MSDGVERRTAYLLRFSAETLLKDTYRNDPKYLECVRKDNVKQLSALMLDRGAIEEEMIDASCGEYIRHTVFAATSCKEVDAIVPKRGFWVSVRDRYYCSVCNAEFNDQLPYILADFDKQGLPEYCPKCGREMQGEVCRK